MGHVGASDGICIWFLANKCVCTAIWQVGEWKPLEYRKIQYMHTSEEMDRNVPVAELLVPGKSRQRSTPMILCRTQRCSAPSLCKATLVATITWLKLSSSPAEQCFQIRILCLPKFSDKKKIHVCSISIRWVIKNFNERLIRYDVNKLTVQITIDIVNHFSKLLFFVLLAQLAEMQFFVCEAFAKWPREKQKKKICFLIN